MLLLFPAGRANLSTETRVTDLHGPCVIALQCWLGPAVPPMRAGSGGEKGGGHPPFVVISSHPACCPRGTHAHLQEGCAGTQSRRGGRGVNLPGTPASGARVQQLGMRRHHIPPNSSLLLLGPHSGCPISCCTVLTGHGIRAPQSRARRLAQVTAISSRARAAHSSFPGPWLQCDVRGRGSNPKGFFKEL